VDGTPFGRYRLVELLGRGGMGEVWRAHDTGTDRIVAIKVLPAQFSENEVFKQRFRREAHAAARLNTPHVIPIYDYGEIDGRLYVCMRLIEGPDLQTVLADGPLEPSRAVRIIEQVAKALHAAHQVDLLHRDVKPSNILLDNDDFAYLIDFGIARAADETRLTGTGVGPGTVLYMAPERLHDRADDEDARVDIYALGCVLYECLTGRPPFAGGVASIIAAHLNTPPPRPSTSQPEVPRQLDEVIASGMAKDPDERYATTVELADAAREAITVPIHQLTPTPATNPATEHALPTDSNMVIDPAPSEVIQTESLPSGDPSVAATEQADWTNQPPTQLAPTPPPAPPKEILGRRQNRHIPIMIAVGAVVVVSVLLVLMMVGGKRSSQETTITSSHSTAPQPSPSVSYAFQVVLPFTGLSSPTGVAVDSVGDVYVADGVNSQVLKLAAGHTQAVVPFTGLSHPNGVAVDGVGDVYVVDRGNSRVLKLAAGSTTQAVQPFSRLGLSYPNGVAVDGAGDVYVVAGSVLELAAGSSSPTQLPFTGLNYPTCVAVDSAGAVYTADNLNSRVLKLPAK
jgi:serine/threonine protein kinase, bacterial